MNLFTKLALLVLLTSSFVSAQAIRKPAPAKPTAKVPVVVTEVAADDWQKLTNLLSAEDWTKASASSNNWLGKLKSENDKKQLARLRYFYLFSLAGSVSQGKLPIAELEKAVNSFIGKEFILLDRNVLGDCNKSLNYLCPVTNTPKAVRVTATNKDFTLIHAFEYVDLLQEFDFKANNLKNAFVGGKLTGAEFNTAAQPVWIMRLYFDEGWVQVVEK